VERLAVKDRDELDDITQEGDRMLITVGGKKKEFPVAQALLDDCLTCEFPTPQEYDILLDEVGPLVCDREISRSQIKELEDMPPEQRWHFWENEFSRCLRCYACRQV